MVSASADPRPAPPIETRDRPDHLERRRARCRSHRCHHQDRRHGDEAQLSRTRRRGGRGDARSRQRWGRDQCCACRFWIAAEPHIGGRVGGVGRWHELYGLLAAAFGWRPRDIDELTLLDIDELLLPYLAEHPPMHVLVAGLMGFKARSAATGLAVGSARSQGTAAEAPMRFARRSGTASTHAFAETNPAGRLARAIAPSVPTGGVHAGLSADVILDFGRLKAAAHDRRI
jgi:hypothetical protein